jgi:hypothetical protein
MKKTNKESKKIVVTLTNQVTVEIVFSDDTYAERYISELKATGILLGSWIKSIEVL